MAFGLLAETNPAIFARKQKNNTTDFFRTKAPLQRGFCSSRGCETGEMRLCDFLLFGISGGIVKCKFRDFFFVSILILNFISKIRHGVVTKLFFREI